MLIVQTQWSMPMQYEILHIMNILTGLKLNNCSGKVMYYLWPHELQKWLLPIQNTVHKDVFCSHTFLDHFIQLYSHCNAKTMQDLFSYNLILVTKQSNCILPPSDKKFGCSLSSAALTYCFNACQSLHSCTTYNAVYSDNSGRLTT